MKCIKAIRQSKNSELGEIKRVDNKTAHRLVGDYWMYIPKSEWKSATRTEKPKVEETKEKRNSDGQTIAEKQLNRKKSSKK